jgi:hypothetical protein
MGGAAAELHIPTNTFTTSTETFSKSALTGHIRHTTIRQQPRQKKWRKKFSKVSVVSKANGTE